MKILSVDDNLENLCLLETMLKAAGCGYEVESAHNGVEALQKLEQEQFELIISDILMPRMDGFELCHKVKQREDLRHIPFIFYTATYTERKDIELGLRLGASRFILKPVEPREFLATVRAVVQEYQAGQLRPAPAPAEPEEMLLQAYNRRLVHKLDRKVKQLELAMAARQGAEEKVRRLNAELEERVRQRTAELAAANQELRTFSSSVSHDLRGPLRSIEGFTRILAAGWRDKLDARGRTCLDDTQAAIQRMDRLIEALLQLARSSRGELRQERVNLSQLAQEIEANLRREEPNRKVDFQLAAGLTTQGDPVLLRCVLQNLLGNAWKYTAKTAQPRIQFGQTKQEGKIGYFVSDNGVGFDMAKAAKLFAPFQRLHEDADFPGTGIGLATVQQIIRRHGGKVWATSEAGKGATFYFSLPQSG